MCECCVLVVIGINLLYILDRCIAFSVGCDEDATGEATTLRDEENTTIVARMQLLHGLVYLQQMLMGKGLINRYVIITPREMSRCSRLLSCAGAAGDAVHMDIAADDTALQSREQSQLDTCGEATWVGEMLSTADDVLVGFWQTVYIVVIASDTEVLCKVDNLHSLRNGVLLEESLALAMAEAEKHYVHFVERHSVGELHLCIAYHGELLLARD